MLRCSARLTTRPRPTRLRAPHFFAQRRNQSTPFQLRRNECAGGVGFVRRSWMRPLCRALVRHGCQRGGIEMGDRASVLEGADTFNTLLTADT